MAGLLAGCVAAVLMRTRLGRSAWMLLVVASLSLVLPGGADARLSWSKPVFFHDEAVTRIFGLACPSLTQCTAVGGSTSNFRFPLPPADEELTFDPRSPGRNSAYVIDPGQNLSAIACASVAECVAVDGAGDEVTFDPGVVASWKVSRVDGAALSSVACPIASRCTAVDAKGWEVTFDPTAPDTRSRAELDSSYLSSVACPSASECVAASRSGREVMFDPAAPASGSGAVIGRELTALSCASASQCTAIDASTSEVTFDPQMPGSPTPESIDTSAVTNIACPSIDQCTATDVFGREVTFDPAQPSSRTMATVDFSNLKGSQFEQIACPSVSQCTEVDFLHDLQITYDPHSPGTPPVHLVPAGAPSVAVRCTSRTRCVVATAPFGYGPTLYSKLLAFNPLAPHPRVWGSAMMNARGLSCPTASECIVVGGGRADCLNCIRLPGGRAAAVSPNHSTNQPPESSELDKAPFSSVSCPTRRQCTAVDTRGRELTFNPEHPAQSQLRSVDRGGELTDVACPSSRQCTTIDGAGIAVTFDPTAPHHKIHRRIDGTNLLSALVCPAIRKCAAVDTGGREVTFDPQGPRNRSSRKIDTSSLLSISCPTTRGCIAGDARGNVIEGSPIGKATWKPESLPGASAILSVSCATAAECVAVDSTGHEYTGTS